MKRLLITGASGFIGASVASLVSPRDWDLHVDRVDLLEPQQRDDLIARLRPTHLIHLAWYVEPGIYWNSSKNTAWLDASIELFRAFARNGGERVVGVGTSAEYDWSAAGAFDEYSTPRVPATLYGESKKRLSEALVTICDEYAISGAWARLFMVYGPGELPSRFVPTAIRALREGQTLRCPKGVVRDLIHVRDAARALLMLAAGSVEGPVNIGSGEPTELKTVGELIGARVETYDDPSEAPSVIAAVKRLHDEVGFTPDLSLQEGLRDAAGWWRERHRR